MRSLFQIANYWLLILSLCGRRDEQIIRNLFYKVTDPTHGHSPPNPHLQIPITSRISFEYGGAQKIQSITRMKISVPTRTNRMLSDFMHNTFKLEIIQLSSKKEGR
jgi:hypothetical protein